MPTNGAERQRGRGPIFGTSSPTTARQPGNSSPGKRHSTPPTSTLGRNFREPYRHDSSGSVARTVESETDHAPDRAPSSTLLATNTNARKGGTCRQMGPSASEVGAPFSERAARQQRGNPETAALASATALPDVTSVHQLARIATTPTRARTHIRRAARDHEAPAWSESERYAF